MASLAQALSTAKRAVAENATLIACLTCFWAFHYIVLWSSSFAIENPTSYLDLSSDLTWVIAVSCNALSLGGFYLLLRRVPSLDYRKISLVASVLAACGIIFIALRIPATGLGWDVAYLAGTALLGVGTGLFMACLANILSAIPPQRTFMCMAASFAGGSLVCLVITIAFVQTAIWIVTAALPFAVAGFYRIAMGKTEDEPVSRGRKYHNADGELSPASFMCFVAFIGLTAGIMRDMNQTGSAAPGSDYLFVVTVLITGLVLFFLSFFADRVKPTLLLQVVVIVISGAFIALVLLAKESSSIAFALHTIGFLCFVALVWFFCTYFSHRRENGTRVFVAGLLANQAGQAVGSLAYLAAMAVFGSADSFTLSISIGMVYLLFVVALVFFANIGKTKRAALAQPSQTDTERVLASVSRQYDLTPREMEIGCLIARGDTRAAIADELVVSQETVKTHTKHLYQKLSIHSRKELLEWIEHHMEKDLSL